MGNIKLGNLEVPLGSILVFVGAVVALISLFLGYVNFDYTVLEDVTYSGMEVVTGWNDNIELSFVHFAPIIVAIAALIGMIMVIIPLFAKLKVDAKIYNIIIAVVMAVAVIFAIVFIAMGAGSGLFAGEWAEDYKFMIETTKTLTMSLGVGAYLGLIGAIVGLVGAGLNVKENL